jgi:hypothetical protein
LLHIKIQAKLAQLKEAIFPGREHKFGVISGFWTHDILSLGFAPAKAGAAHSTFLNRGGGAR